jgi:integrase
MSARKPRGRARSRVGRVSVYAHHNSWWVYYRDAGRVIRRKVASNRADADQVAAQINAQLALQAPTLVGFTPVTVPVLRREFLEHHEHVLNSTIPTINRYRSATQHLENFSCAQGTNCLAHAVRPEAFVRYLRTLEIAPNGHANTAKRRLRDKGLHYILEVCRSMYAFAGKRRYLPPYAGNPFAELPIDKFKIEDAKPIFVFDEQTELAFFRAADAWSFPLHFTLAKTGLRVGELTHLLFEDLDLAGGWLHVRNKPALGWRVKTGGGRSVPLLPEVVAVLRRLLSGRQTGPVFLRRSLLAGKLPLLVGDQKALERAYESRQRAIGRSLARAESQRIAQTVWRDAGAVKADNVRTSFVQIMQRLGRPDATCPKSWRHTFATLLQDGNVDPLIRQQTLGHRPTNGAGLGMTAVYTHTRPETQRVQIEQALRQWPRSLECAINLTKGV